MLRKVASSQDASVDSRMQSLHPAIQDLRKASKLGDAMYLHSGSFQRLPGATGAEYLNAQFF
jgi:hypothetical protein